ncbi:hypothetical protein VF10_36200 [Nostoc linckia z13]|nr:hypothetical protein VF10_36200 [Nostoc linckia z13]PHK32671.1 hypothetical protein VF12_26295 [Nostoc linckia z15]
MSSENFSKFRDWGLGTSNKGINNLLAFYQLVAVTTFYIGTGIRIALQMFQKLRNTGFLIFDWSCLIWVGTNNNFFNPQSPTIFHSRKNFSWLFLEFILGIEYP